MARMRHRRGVSLLEVLIAMGILAVGLSSVAAIIPAARSQAARAVLLDRAAVLAANVLADAATFGLLRSGTDTLSLGSRPPIVLIDPAGVVLDGPVAAAPRDRGSFGGGAATNAPAQRLIFQSRDDVTVTLPSGNVPPTNRLIDGTRAFEGRLTSLLCLSGTVGGPHRASVVVFHNRDPGTLVINGTLTDSSLVFAPPAGRTRTEIVRPGVVLWQQAAGRFHQVTAVSPSLDGSLFFLTLGSGAVLATGTHPVQILPDSVGLAERSFTPETGGALAP